MKGRLRMLETENEAERFSCLNQIRAELIGSEPADEADHFLTCPTCGQAFDLRKLGDVFHHHKPMHKPQLRS
jgi:hypothetical protein